MTLVNRKRGQEPIGDSVGGNYARNSLSMGSQNGLLRRRIFIMESFKGDMVNDKRVLTPIMFSVSEMLETVFRFEAINSSLGQIQHLIEDLSSCEGRQSQQILQHMQKDQSLHSDLKYS